MIVICLSDCPPKVRGDLTRWLFEISTNVYVGNVSARVRDKIWKRICDNIGTGRATLVFTTNNEQGFDFAVSGTIWEPVDYDGLKLMRIPSLNRMQKEGDDPEKGEDLSRDEQIRITQYRKKKDTFVGKKYVVLDVKTTGPDVKVDRIIEIGAIKVQDGKIIDTYDAFIKINQKLPENIEGLTGISDQYINDNGISLRDGLIGLERFVDGEMVIGYNILDFDIRVLRYECKRENVDFYLKRVKDIYLAVKKKMKEISNYRLETVAEQLEIVIEERRRAIDDCKIEIQIFEIIG